MQSETIDHNRLDSLLLLRIQNSLNSLAMAMRDMLDTAVTDDSAALRYPLTIVRLTGSEGTQSRIVHPGSNYLSQSGLALTFGIGRHDKASRVSIEWPIGARRNLRTSGREVIAAPRAQRRKRWGAIRWPIRTSRQTSCTDTCTDFLWSHSSETRPAVCVRYLRQPTKVSRSSRSCTRQPPDRHAFPLVPAVFRTTRVPPALYSASVALARYQLLYSKKRSAPKVWPRRHERG